MSKPRKVPKAWDDMNSEEKKTWKEALARHLDWAHQCFHAGLPCHEAGETATGTYDAYAQRTEPLITFLYLFFAMHAAVFESVIEIVKPPIYSEVSEALSKDGYDLLWEYRNAIFHVPKSLKDERLANLWKKIHLLSRLHEAKNLIINWVNETSGETL